MNVDIYIRERKGSREIRIPWLPEEIVFASGGTVRATYDIMDKGPVEIPTGAGLCAYSWSSEFPGERRTDDSMMRGEWKNPETYHKILEDWKAKGTPLVLLVTGYPINKDVLLDDYEGKAAGGFGDIEYDLSFIEDREITITSTEVQKVQDNMEKRPSTQSTSYTVKKGDSLWKIAAMSQHGGKGSDWEKIYEANKTIIEKTAQKHGKKSSSNGWWIYPGMVLTIPTEGGSGSGGGSSGSSGGSSGGSSSRKSPGSGGSGGNSYGGNRNTTNIPVPK